VSVGVETIELSTGPVVLAVVVPDPEVVNVIVTEWPRCPKRWQRVTQSDTTVRQRPPKRKCADSYLVLSSVVDAS